MSDSFLEFDNALKAFGTQTIETHRNICSKLGLDIMGDLTIESPVDTGRFRSGWIFNLQVETEEVPPDYKDKISGDPRYTAEASKRAEEAIKNATEAPNFPRIYVQNNVEYGPALNDGHSAQAPAGFVEAAVDRNVAALPK